MHNGSFFHDSPARPELRGVTSHFSFRLSNLELFYLLFSSHFPFSSFFGLCLHRIHSLPNNPDTKFACLTPTHSS